MPLAIEINKDQQSLLWRRHLLTEVMKTMHVHDLTLEPVLNPPEAEDARVKIEKGHASMKWEWGNWTRVDISVNHLDKATVVRSYAIFQPPEAKWRDLPAVSELDVRFRNDNGTTACARMQVPELTNFGRDVEFGRWIQGSVQVRLARPVAAARVEVELLRLGQHGTFKLKGNPKAFAVGERQLDIPVPDDFFGIIAVVAKQHKSERLIAAADFNDHGEVIPQSIVNDKLQEVIDSRYSITSKPKPPSLEEWLRSWPSFSHQRLTALYELARQHFSRRQLTLDDEDLKAHPTGLLRYLTLIQCGFESLDPRKLIGRLNHNSFQKALNSAVPALGAAIAALRTPEEKIWAIQNARNPNLQEAVNEAKNEGVPALRRALHLADKRAEAIAARQSRRTASSVSAAQKNKQ